MNLDLVRRIRQVELELVLALLPPRARVLEVGAGAGWQAAELAAAGYSVEAIDLAHASYRKVRVWDVRTYDGKHIPFPDGSFGAVFSSNTLEHIPHVKEFQAELLRVLEPGGVAIHVLPTPTWRVWTTLTHYPQLAKQLLSRLQSQGSNSVPGAPITTAQARAVLLPPRHGSCGNVVSEMVWFSRKRWRRLFTGTGWQVVGMHPVRLFYSGNLILGDLLSISMRRTLSRWLGSSGLIYVLRPQADH